MGIGDDDPKNAAKSRSGYDNHQDFDTPDCPDPGFFCKRCENTGLLPIPYKTLAGEPARGVACCGCAWGSFYYHIFSTQGMNPTYYDNWPDSLTNKQLDSYHNIIEFTRQLYWSMRKDANMGYRDEEGNWVSPENLLDNANADERDEDHHEFNEEDLIPDE